MELYAKYGTKYSRMDHDMVCLSRPYHFRFFKGCLPQILLTLFLNILTHMRNEENIDHNARSKSAITRLSLTYKIPIVT